MLAVWYILWVGHGDSDISCPWQYPSDPTFFHISVIISQWIFNKILLNKTSQYWKDSLAHSYQSGWRIRRYMEQVPSPFRDRTASASWTIWSIKMITLWWDMMFFIPVGVVYMMDLCIQDCYSQLHWNKSTGNFYPNLPRRAVHCQHNATS